MKLKTLLLLLLLSLFLKVNAQNKFETIVYYPTGKYELSPADKNAVNGILKDVPLDLEFHFIIRGYADSIGSIKNNSLLSKKRAQGILRHLISQGISERKIQIEFYGEDRKFRSSSLINLKMDRMATLDLLIPEKAEVWGSYDGQRISNFYKRSKIDGDEFLINTDADTVIRCSGGTVIHISKNSFGQNGQRLENQKVIIKVREVFKKSEMILENLSTTSGNRLLQTAGMIHILATLNDKEVNVLPLKPLTIFMPSKTNLKNTKLFDGHISSKDSTMDWRNQNPNLNIFQMPNCYGCWSRLCRVNSIEDCPLFFCKIKRFFKVLLNRNKEIPEQVIVDDKCDYLVKQLEGYGITATLETMEQVLTPLFIKYEVSNYNELILALENQKISNIEVDIKDETVNWEDFQYYVFQRQTLGWINCDEFQNLDPELLTDLKIKTKPGEFTDAKLVFKNRNSILWSEANNGYNFKGIPKNELAWIVAIKENKGKIFLFMDEINTSDKSIAVKWEKVSLKDLQNRLDSIDN